MVNLRLQSLISLLMTILFISSCARSEGTINVNETSNAQNIDGIPTQIPAAAIDEVIAYFEALNLALDSGDITRLKSGRFDNCGCLEIAQNIAEIWSTSNLLGGDYLIKRIAPLRIGANNLQIKVLVNRTEVLKVDRNTGSVESWPQTEISTNFSMTKSDGSWVLTESSSG